MANIDLVPDEYRYWIWQRRWLQLAAAALLSICVLGFASSYAFENSASRVSLQLQQLQSSNAVSSSQQQRLEFLSEKQYGLEKQWQLLLGLRGGATVENLFVVIDNALVGDRVWFEDWQFLRAGHTVEPQQIGSERDRGAYIIVLGDQASQQPDTPSAWSIKTHLNISGGADDHAALSAFVERLLQQPRISDVKVLSTSLYSDRDETSAITFDLSVLVNNALEAG